MSLDSHILSLQTLFDSALAEGFEAAVQLDLADQEFRADVSAGRLTVERGRHASPAATIRTDPTTLIDVLHERRDLAGARAAGDLEIDGDEEVAERFLRLAPLPKPVVAQS